MSTRQPNPHAREGELPDEFRTRQIMARCQARAARAYEQQQKQALKEMRQASLATYRAAKVDRRNRDWMQGNASADLALIPDAITLIARARQLVRDFPLAKSAVRAYVRNVVGNGIVVTPHAKDANGNPLTAFNRAAAMEWHRWANSKQCHVEGRQTFRQIQRLAARERFTVGEHLLMWSYHPPTDALGRLDKSRPCGLQLQGFEPEQFDLRIISYEGHEVRGGVEIDENYRPVAYHIYSRNPWDVLYRHAFFSIRVGAERMFHYMDFDRVLQSRGEPPLACVMQTLRDLERYNGATLTRAMMEACIGLVIKTQMPVPVQPGLGSYTFGGGGGAQAAGGNQTGSGMSEADFVPGMVAKLRPNEDVSTVFPSTPGNQYPPFVTMNTRMAGAGIGMSYGQVMRENMANYSAARQDMLEDRKEFEPEQSLLVDQIIQPVYERFLSFAVSEGRFDGVANFDRDDFYENSWRYTQADHVPPPMPWIDPEKEANAYKELLSLNLITREEIAALRGKRFLDIVLKRGVERKTLIGAGLEVPEEAQDNQQRRDLIKSFLMSRDPSVSAIVTNHTDIAQVIKDAQLASRDAHDQPDLPINIAPPPMPGAKSGEPAPAPNGPPQQSPPPAANGNGKANGKSGSNGNGNGKAGKARAGRRISLSVADAPHYRPGGQAGVVDCASCSYAAGQRCTMYDFTFEPTYVCDSWAARTLTDNLDVPSTSKTFPPIHRDGEPDIERQFWPAADPLKEIPGMSMS